MTVLVPPPPDPEPIEAKPPYAPFLEFQRGRKFTFEDFAKYMDGTTMLPNFEPIPLEQAAHIATMLYGHLHHRRYAKTDPRGGRAFRSALYMLECGQGGDLTGEGYVIVGHGRAEVTAGRFAICKHEKVEGQGANHDRGWHPGHCRICGLDMSVDSGD